MREPFQSIDFAIGIWTASTLQWMAIYFGQTSMESSGQMAIISGSGVVICLFLRIMGWRAAKKEKNENL